jgi:hypothetical protein
MKLIPVKSGEKWGYINKKGEYVINPQFKDAEFFRNGLAKVESFDGKTGYISEDGKYKIPAKYKDGTPFKDGLAFVVSDGGYPTCIDKSDAIKFQLKQAKYAFCFTEELAMFVTSGDKFGFVDKSGKVVVNPQFESARPFSEGLAAVRQKKKWGFIDKSGKIVINPQFDVVLDFHAGKAVFFNGKQCGFIDTKGSYVINPQFDAAMSFSEGMAAIYSGKQFGFITEDGKIEINPQFEYASSFKNGLAVIKQGDKYGFINKKGKIEINPQFDDVSMFFDDVAYVETADKWGIINKQGKYLVNPQFDDLKREIFEWNDLKDNAYYLVPYVRSNYYDITEFINKFFKKADKNSFDGFTAASTLQSIADNSLYGDNLKDDSKYKVDCNKAQKITNDISIDKTSFLFSQPIYKLIDTYETSWFYRYKTGTKKQYVFSEKISAIAYQFDLSDDAYDKGGSIANALKSEIEKRYGVKMESANEQYTAYQENGKLSFVITYNDYMVTLYVGFSKNKLQSSLNQEGYVELEATPEQDEEEE